MRKILSILAVSLCALLAAFSFVACGDKPEQGGEGDGVTPEITGMDLSEYKILQYADDLSNDVYDGAEAFRAELSRLTGVKPVLRAYKEYGGKAFLLGNTGNEQSEKAMEKIDAAVTGEEHGYAVVFTQSLIVINGNDDTALLAGMKYFLNTYAENAKDKRIDAKAGDEKVRAFNDGELRIFPNLVQWELELTSQIDKSPADNLNAVLKYPCIIELNHQPSAKDNGTLIATGERWAGSNLCPVYRSTDGGKEWELVTQLEDTIHRGFGTAYAPSVFELPVAVGEMPAGTLIIGADSINSSWTEIHIVLFRSFDKGDTWEAFTTLASGGSALGAKGGVWEPYFYCTDNGTLVCHYSDEVNSPSSQMLVYRATKDGKQWSDIVKTVELSDRRLRPGMPVVTRLGDGRYMLVYEIVVLPGNPVYCKYSDDGLDWGNADDRGKLISTEDGKSLAATPWVAFGGAGSTDKGVLVVTGWRMATGTSETGSDIFVSFDYGESWTAIPNFYSYVYHNDDDIWGYSVCTFFSPDGKTMYYMANPKGETERAVYTLYKFAVT